MRITNADRIAEIVKEATVWRREYHAHPELGFDVTQTAASVASHLRDFGCEEVVENVGKSGVVGFIHGQPCDSPRVIAFRADLDALPIEEDSSKSWSSKTTGLMHACGHDGHTSMLLAAAKYLAETRDFQGTVVTVFQPAEEIGQGGQAMIDDGLLERWGIQEIYGLHNMPGLPVGCFATRSGPVTASYDEFDIEIAGVGTHAAMPHHGVDALAVAGQVISGLQLLCSRETDPLASLVVSLTKLEAGGAYNVIPEKVALSGCVRALTPEVRDHAERRIIEITKGIAHSFGATATTTYRRCLSPTRNHEKQTQNAILASESVPQVHSVLSSISPTMGSEDFGAMLEKCPGAIVMIGNGDSAPLHNPQYDFNDSALLFGVWFWVSLAEARHRSLAE